MSVEIEEHFVLKQVDYGSYDQAGFVLKLKEVGFKKPLCYLYPDGKTPNQPFTENQKITALLYAVAQFQISRQHEWDQEKDLDIKETYTNLWEKYKKGQDIFIPQVIGDSFLKNLQSFLELTPKHLAPHW